MYYRAKRNHNISGQNNIKLLKKTKETVYFFIPIFMVCPVFTGKLPTRQGKIQRKNISLYLFDVLVLYATEKSAYFEQDKKNTQ